jgi:Uma2 family endonuclease
MSQVITPTPSHVVLHPISWKTFEALLEDLGEHRGRIAYDRGTFEIMSPSKKHEGLKKLIGRLIEAFTEEMGETAIVRAFRAWVREQFPKS